MATQQEIIKKFMASLDKTTKTETAALDEAIKACSTFKSMQDAVDKMVADCKAAKSADDFLKTYCGIILDNDDTGAITGSDAGGSTVKTKESIVPESGAAKNFTGDSFTVNGLTIKLGKGRTFSDLNDSEKYIWQGLYTWWAKGALDLIAESYGDNFSFGKKSSATIKELEFNFYTSEADDHSGAVTSYVWYNSGQSHSLSMRVDLRAFGSLVDGINPDGKSNWTSTYLDSLLAHEFTHAAMFANINYNAQLPSLVHEGISELTIGNTDASGMSALASDPELLKKTLANEDGTNPYAGGFMFFRYLARQAGDLTLTNTVSKKSLQTFNGNDSIYSVADNVTISTGAGNDSIHGAGKKITINGGAGNNFVLLYSNAANASVLTGSGKDSIESGGQKATINSGSGNDYVYLFNNGENQIVNTGKGNDSVESGAQTASINAGAGNDYILLFTSATKHTVKGGAGNDTVQSYTSNGVVYQFAAGDGNDVINGFGATDSISISGGTYKRSTVGSDVVLTVDTGKITLKNVAGKTINVITAPADNKVITLTGGNDTYSNAASSVMIQAKGGNDSVFNSGANVTLDGGDGNDDLSNRGKKVSVFGGAGNDSLWNEPPMNNSLGADNVTISSGAGHDSVNNFASNTTILGGAGKDTVYNYGILYHSGTALFKGLGKNVKINTGADNDVIYNGGDYAKIDGGDGNDFIQNGIDWNGTYGAYSTLNGGAGNDSITNFRNNVSITGGAGNDSIQSNAKNVTYFYAAGDGNDVINGFGANSTLSISGGAYSTAKSGSNVVVTVGNGKITLQGAANLSKLNIKGTTGGGTNSTLMTVTNSTKSPVTIGAAVKTVDATKRTSAVNLTGNALANSISGGSGADLFHGGAGNDSILGNAGNDKIWGDAGNDILRGGAGNDSLAGGAGNDSLWGDAGNDKFFYADGGGKDVIFGFETNDLLQITGTFAGTYNSSKKEIAFKVGSTADAITLKNFSTTTFNINGDRYGISGTRLVKK